MAFFIVYFCVMPSLYSFIIPVYNRPEELRELLHSISLQDKNIATEVIVVEDGSTLRSESVVHEFSVLNLQYYYKENTGPGDSRNFGMQRATGDYFIILDSDCILSSDYLTAVDQALNDAFVDCFGGPDGAHSSFDLRQKAISFVMTSVLTTGGIRGSERKLKRFEPRSFNMGLSKKAFKASNGFGDLHPGEDPELVHRLWDLGFETGYIAKALVYHKRRITWKSYAQQVYKFGLARSILNLWRPEYASWVFWLPLFIVTLGLASIICFTLDIYALIYLALVYAVVIGFVGMLEIRSVKAIYVVPWTFSIQTISYASGFFVGWLFLHLLKRDPNKEFSHMFFKQ